MAAPDLTRRLHLRGTLIKDPTDLTIASPYGGTQLGLSRDAAFAVGHGQSEVRAEEFGNIVIEYLLAVERALLTALLAEWDKDALDLVFANQASPPTGTKWADNVSVIEGRVSGAGVTLPGTKLSDNSFKLLFASDEPETHPSVLIYNAIPLVQATATMQLNRRREFGLAHAFQAIPNANHRLYQVERLAYLDLAG